MPTTEAGIRTADAEYPLDIIVLATGFDAATGAINAIDIRGRDGVSLKSLWDRDITTAMGLQKHGFPNFFTSAAPLAPTVARRDRDAWPRTHPPRCGGAERARDGARWTIRRP